ncbi:MAG: hypothetical protein AAGK33_15290 [Pseudomonadota bacterium]
MDFFFFFTGFFLATAVFLVDEVDFLAVVFLVDVFFLADLVVVEERLVATFFLSEEVLAFFFAPLPGFERQKAFTRAPSERVNAATWEQRLLDVQALLERPLQADCAIAGALLKAASDRIKAKTVTTRAMVDLKSVM